MNEPVITPWGQYQVIRQGPGYLVKIITVNPGARTSLQYHEHRDESWTVLEGELYMRFGEDFSTGAIVHIGRTEKHRIENLGDVPLVILEVWLGEDLREDDIVRLEDDYGRAER